MRDPGDVVDFSWQGGTPADGRESVVRDLGGESMPGGEQGEHAARGRYLRLWFSCSGEYGRAYMNAAGDGYHARCPRCGKQVRFQIGPGGSSERFFEVRCG